MDDSGTAIIVALSSHNITKVLLFDVSTEEGTVRLLSSFANPPHLYTLRAIHPASQTVVFSHGLTVFFVNWSSHRFYSVLPHDDDEELWTGPVGIAFLSSHHVLCVKTRSADVYTLSDVAEMTMKDDTLLSSQGLATLVDLGVRTVHRQSFPVQKATLRGVAFSEPYIDRSSHTDVCTASFLAYDVLHGLFHFEVQLILPPGIDTVRHPPQPPLPFDATCTLVAVRPMAQRFVTYEAISDDTSPPRTELALGSSAFISACALGTRGKRGVWTERQREHMSRAVYGFASADHCAVRSDTPRGEEDVGVVHPAPAEVHCKRLYEVQTYDLRDDLTHCAFSEVTGRIILGTRRGQVQFL
ncbi:hypothetical protein PHLGIDRAFT_129177 [Phlebiopsis gigantea 11061_1 CR5-6]|uniref:Cleavage/polyadenylation specificity factor A subunit N-terminal domain-containing protein n=1 Tax=Phlebiopsis gigantea (strain 11061_1 CR5-6) TaxID=745531 RepID=A0A0C3S7X9_PHLG1|nr:hypothetical protein PHLGIDRAFT_129177 [Phlebiopsis gigantea 11061_1 CR5-6]